MLILKIFYHIKSLIKLLFYRIIYLGKLRVGKHVTFRNRFNLAIESGRVEIGNNVFFNNDCSITALENIVIGDNCIFGENVKLYDHNHKYKNKNELIYNQGFSTGKITIGKNCWIGSNVVILKGVTIGDNSVIGAGVVLFKNVVSDAVVINKQQLEEVKSE